ncbi:hypothetical protein B0I35DRAFT_415010 [Stachybotrys elegans]|uniref:Uncharacterized protein n=1 Tax=Stachybotrys elegans TaxID=80388 RepID=A0A8K0WJP8_9HYPO|nr:hypothetical protein B0I35DRAFT_415010 [Stachybotrys elegans]
MSTCGLTTLCSDTMCSSMPICTTQSRRHITHAHRPRHERTNRQGDYLHGMLPRIYRHGVAPPNEPEKASDDISAQALLQVPTRWLVVRSRRGLVVESDRQWSVDISPFVSGGDGVKVIERRGPSRQAPASEELQPIFVSYQLHSINVFSIVNDFGYSSGKGPSLAMAHYYVIGWHSQDHGSHVSASNKGEQEAAKRTQCLAELHMKLKRDEVATLAGKLEQSGLKLRLKQAAAPFFYIQRIFSSSEAWHQAGHMTSATTCYPTRYQTAKAKSTEALSKGWKDFSPIAKGNCQRTSNLPPKLLSGFRDSLTMRLQGNHAKPINRPSSTSVKPLPSKQAARDEAGQMLTPVSLRKVKTVDKFGQALHAMNSRPRALTDPPPPLYPASPAGPGQRCYPSAATTTAGLL